MNSILISNRGEIASRIIRTCRKMGIRSIAVFSEADRRAPFVREADVAVCIGESDPSASYLNPDKIIAAAKQTGAQAIHPGYGFLSENAAFARRCQEEGIIFIGPHPEAIAAMGSKSRARELMQTQGVPVVPGYQGPDQSEARLIRAANEIGYPVLLKATAGGGGKGMRIVHAEGEMKVAIAAAQRESQRAFGEAELIVEKYIVSGRHIEFQIFGDRRGNVIHLLERECTLQRRYQKVIEESPSPVMDEALRTRMGDAAVRAAQALHYDNAGTVEFIYDQHSGEFYFLEVNTRLQVEHPVTEAILGLDLVQMQIESAQGKPLSLSQEEVRGRGYALECRLYAEDARNDFLPVTGTVQRFSVPEVDGLRVESAVESGTEISVYYDPMIAKLIVWAEDRATAHRKMAYVLRHLACLGTTTNQDFLLSLVEHPAFQRGEYDTHFIDHLDLSVDPREPFYHQAAIAACVHAWHQRQNSRTLLRSLPSGWRNSFYQPQEVQYLMGDTELRVEYRLEGSVFQFQVESVPYQVSLEELQPESLRLEINGLHHRFQLSWVGDQYFVQNESFGNLSLRERSRFPAKVSIESAGTYLAPMPSQVVKVLVKPGQSVQAGDPLLVMSSMKMENTLLAKENGTISDLYATEGSNVPAGFVLLKIHTP